MGKFIDLTGQTFGRWLVEQKSDKIGAGGLAIGGVYVNAKIIHVKKSMALRYVLEKVKAAVVLQKNV